MTCHGFRLKNDAEAEWIAKTNVSGLTNEMKGCIF